MFIFKLIAIQEYVHIEQHKEEWTHQENCQVCLTIFQIGKYQTFDSPETFIFIFTPFSVENKLTSDLYAFVFGQKLNSSELYNRPPPTLS